MARGMRRLEAEQAERDAAIARPHDLVRHVGPRRWPRALPRALLRRGGGVALPVLLPPVPPRLVDEVGEAALAERGLAQQEVGGAAELERVVLGQVRQGVLGGARHVEDRPVEQGLAWGSGGS